MLLEGKVAIVTGAGGGIGRAEALLFAKEGARVVVNDAGVGRDGMPTTDGPSAAAVVAEIEAAGGVAVASTSSIDTAEGAQSLVELAMKTWGQLDVLVNNAGILRDRSILKMDLESWERVLEVQLTGTLLCTQAAARQMIASGKGGRIVNTTAVAGMVGNLGQSNLAAATAGVYGLTRTSAIELQKHRVFVNAVAPIAKTRMTEDLPMFHRIDTLTPAHVAPAALFLASPLAKEKTGFVLAVSGAQMYAFKVIQTQGRFKEGEDPWTADEIAASWDTIVKS